MAQGFIGVHRLFDRALDLISMRAFAWSRDGGEIERPISPEEQAAAVAGRWAIVEALAESGCEQALGWFADGVSPSPDELAAEGMSLEPVK